jgi:outer membrane protein assembly complex protein YaeT
VTRTGLLVAVAACLWAVGAERLAAQGGQTSGQRITAIYLEPRDQPLSRDQIGLSLGVRPGDRFDEIRLSEAIERLFGTGRYRDIYVTAEPENGGVALTFHTKPETFVSAVTVTGVPDPPNPARLVSATRLELGMPLDEEADLPAAVEGLREVLRSNGFHTAQIQHDLTRRERTQETSIRFNVIPGARARFSRPVITGSPEQSERRLLRATGWQRWWGLRGWKDVTEQRVSEGLERLRSSYLKRDHLLARVVLKSLEYEPETNTIRPELEIEAGPRVFIRAEGAKVSRGLLRDLTPVYQERTVDRELLLEGQNNLVEHFQARGYFDAKASFRMTDPDASGEQRITYVIDRGPRYRLAHVAFSGNQYFRDETIRERLSITPARFPQYRRGRFSRALLERDRDVLMDLYRSNGFRDAVVQAEVEQNYQGKPLDLAVKLTIEEGQQWFVSDLELAGVNPRLLDTIGGLLNSTPGQPFSVVNVANDRDSVLNWYYNSGYPEATFDAQTIPVEGEARVALRYTIDEGRRNFVRDVLVNGLEVTKPDLVANRITVAPDEPLSQGGIVETQRQLYDLGIFAKVDVAVQNPLGRERNKYVLMQVEEARKYSLNLGLGAEFGRLGGGGANFDSPAGAAGFSPRVQVSLGRSNFGGLGHTASGTIRVSRFQRRALLNYFAPQFRGNEDVNLTFSNLIDRSQDIRTFTSTRLESAIQIGQRLSRANTLQYRVIVRNVSLEEETLKIDPNLIPVFSQPVSVTVFSSSFIQDRRDDPLDSTRGVYNTVDFGYAPGLLGRKASYTRLSARNSTYHRIRRNVVVARTATIGWLYNLQDAPVPLAERFFAGGATSHRGFPENQAGQRDPVTGFPVGGNAFVFFGTELRFPLLGDNLGAVLFHDMGNVYSSLSSISLRYRQRDRADFDYMVHAAGVGVRLKTPVGPVRVDLAYAPNSPRFVGFRGTRDDLINRTGSFNVPQRVRPFQFHFSIGQSF